MQMEIAWQFFLINLPPEVVNSPWPSLNWALLQLEHDRSSSFGRLHLWHFWELASANSPPGERGAPKHKLTNFVLNCFSVRKQLIKSHDISFNCSSSEIIQSRCPLQQRLQKVSAREDSQRLHRWWSLGHGSQDVGYTQHIYLLDVSLTCGIIRHTLTEPESDLIILLLPVPG